MPQGIQVFNTDGSLQFDTSSRVYRVLTVALAGGVSGSLTNTGLSTGTAIINVLPGVSGAIPPTVTVTGNTVSWSYTDSSSGSSGPDPQSRIIVGVF